MTKPHAIESARQSRATNGGTWYVITLKRPRGLDYSVIPQKLYRSKLHGIVVAIIGTA